MLQKEFKYYLACRDKFVKEHEGKVLVIKGRRLIGIYEDELTAIKKTLPHHALGTFLVQECSADPNSINQKYRSRVSF